MIQSKYQGCRIVARSINPSLKFAHAKESIHTTEFSIADFGNTHHHYQRKKKRCPFFLMNKSPKKKTHETTTVFTNQGIKMEPRITYQPVLTTTNESRKVSLSKPKAPLNVNKRRYSNPSRLASPSTLNSPQNVIEFPLFYFYPKDRCLQSALTNRQAQKLKSSKSGRSFHPK